MFSQINIGDTVLVNGLGKTDNMQYTNLIAIVIERDSYYKDFLVRFNDGTEDWFSPKFLHILYKKRRQKK